MADQPRTAWCPECSHRVTVEDQHDEGHYEHGREVGYVVTDLACGHSLQTSSRDLGPGPGAPYAGDGGLTRAATHHPRDLARPAADPWADR